MYDYRRKTFIGSVLRSPAAEWFDSIEAALGVKNFKKEQFVAHFTNGKMQFRFRTEVEISKKQCNESIRSYKYRIKTLVDKGWPRFSASDTNARTPFENWRIGKYKEYLIRSLTLSGHKQKAHQPLNEDSNKRWNALQMLKLDKKASLVKVF